MSSGRVLGKTLLTIVHLVEESWDCSIGQDRDLEEEDQVIMMIGLILLPPVRHTWIQVILIVRD